MWLWSYMKLGSFLPELVPISLSPHLQDQQKPFKPEGLWCIKVRCCFVHIVPPGVNKWGEWIWKNGPPKGAPLVLFFNIESSFSTGSPLLGEEILSASNVSQSNHKHTEGHFMIYRTFSRKSFKAATALWSWQERVSEAREVPLLLPGHTVYQPSAQCTCCFSAAPTPTTRAHKGSGQRGQPSQQVVWVSSHGALGIRTLLLPLLDYNRIIFKMVVAS